MTVAISTTSSPPQSAPAGSNKIRTYTVTVLTRSVLFTDYRTVGNFQGRKLWRTGGSKKFAEKNFVDCLAPPLTCGRGHQFLWRKLSRIDPKPRNS